VSSCDTTSGSLLIVRLDLCPLAMTEMVHPPHRIPLPVRPPLVRLPVVPLHLYIDISVEFELELY
jgi:hypothetical protein